MFLFTFILLVLVSVLFAFMIHYRNEAKRWETEHDDEMSARLVAETRMWTAEKRHSDLNFKHLVLTTDYRCLATVYKRDTGKSYSGGSSIHGVYIEGESEELESKVETEDIDTTVLDWLR
jgi:hypothetical protein